MFHLCKAHRQLMKPIINNPRYFHVAVVGASSPLSRSVSLLLKQNSLINRFTVYDFFEDTFSVAKDLSFIPRQPLVESCTGRIENALCGSHIVVVTGGQQRKSRQDDLSLFRDNADFIISTMQEVQKYCPNAFIVIATEPINYLIPLASKVLELDAAYEKRKLLGVTSLDTMITQTCVSSFYRIPATEIKVPVICGHSAKTIVPLLSHVNPYFDIDVHKTSSIIEAVRQVDNNISSLMFGKAALLSAAYATYCTTSAILEALNGFAVEHVAFVANNDFGTKFFASPVIITSQGVSAKMQFQCVTEQEANFIYQAADHLKNEVYSGEFYYVPTECYRKANENQEFTKTL